MNKMRISALLTCFISKKMDWMAGACGLPDAFLSAGNGGGCIQGTASESTLVTLLSAKTRILSKDKSVRPELLVAYTSEHAHSSVDKAARLAGVQLRKVNADSGFRMSAEALESAIIDDIARGLVPCYCCANVGTTNSCAIDPVSDIGQVCSDHSIWLHVDAAYAGSATICPEFRWIFNGIASADSLCFNAHKWLCTNFDCSLMWVKDRTSIISAMGGVTAEYLRSDQHASGLVLDYRDWQIPLGRRFRSLKLWFVLRAYGLSQLRDHIRNGCRQAHLFSELVLSDSRFEISAPVQFGLVCFRLLASDDVNEKLEKNLNDSGKTFLVHTKLDGKYVIRFATGCPRTRDSHIQEVWKLICTEATQLLASN